MNSLHNVIVNTEDYVYFHHTQKDKEYGYAKTAIVDRTHLVQISKEDFIKAGNARAARKIVSFDNQGKLTVLTRKEMNIKPKWFETAVFSNGECRVVTRSKQELAEILKQERNRRLTSKKIRIDEVDSGRYFISDDKTLQALRSYAGFSGDTSTTTTWVYDEGFMFNISIEEMLVAINAILDHHITIRNEYAAMLASLYNEGIVKDYIKWSPDTAVAEV